MEQNNPQCPKCHSHEFKIVTDVIDPPIHEWECCRCKWWGVIHADDYSIDNWIWQADTEQDSDWTLPDWVVVHQPDQGTLPGLDILS